jgi:hypothetical protein
MSYLEIAKSISTKYEKNELSREQTPSPNEMYETYEESRLGSSDKQHVDLTDLLAIEDLDVTVERILALTDDQRARYYAELIHDWRAWRVAMERFGKVKKGV